MGQGGKRERPPLAGRQKFARQTKKRRLVRNQQNSFTFLIDGQLVQHPERSPVNRRLTLGQIGLGVILVDAPTFQRAKVHLAQTRVNLGLDRREAEFSSQQLGGFFGSRHIRVDNQINFFRPQSGGRSSDLLAAAFGQMIFRRQ